MRKRVLITGGGGLLGYHLKARLSAGNEVREPTFPIQTSVPRVIVDEIYNLAGTPAPREHSKRPIFVDQTNTIGVINILELARYTRAKVFQASTIDVSVSFDPQSENSCYQEGKRMAETLFYDYHRFYGVDIRVARMGNFYGPFCKVKDPHVIPTFIRKALKGEDIVVVGTGSQVRNFCYVEDMVDYILMLMESNFTHPVYAIGKDNISIKELAEFIIVLTDSKSKVLFTNHIELRQRRVVGETVCELFGWEPKVRLEEGLVKTIEYFRGVLHESDVKENVVHPSPEGVGARSL